MERNREGRRAAATAGSAVSSVTRRPRVKDASDDEDRLDDVVEARTWERSKKERLATFHVSASAMNPRNKRKRPVLPQESHVPGGRSGVAVEDADEYMEETEAVASEDDDEPPPPPLQRRPGKARVQAKEDEIVMEIPSVPRKARSSISSTSRFSLISRRPVEPQPADVLRQKSPAATQTPLNGGSSPNFLQKQGRKPKPVGPKARVMKVPKVQEPSISDQEVEVAEALFVLARGVEVKPEPEARTGSPPAGPLLSSAAATPHTTSVHHSGSITNGYISSHLKDATAPAAEAPKRKRPRVIVKPDDGRVSTPVRLVASGAVSSSASPSVPIHPSVGETELDEKTHTDAFSMQSDLSKVKATTDAAHSAVSEEKKIGFIEHDDIEQGELKLPKQETQSVADTGEVQSERSGHGMDAVDGLRGNDSSIKAELASRPADVLRNDDGSVSKMNIDLMASPMKHFPMEEGASLSIEKQTMGDNSAINSMGYNGQAHVEEQSKQSLVLEDAVRAMDVARGLSKPKERLDVEKQEVKEEGEHQMHDHLHKEQMASQTGRGAKEEKETESLKVLSRPQKEEPENAAFVSPTLSTAASSSAPVALARWMGGLPQLGYYGPGATPWAAGASLPNTSVDVKAAHSAMQLPPHGAIISPVPRMKRCATHVYMAHFIYREQQVSRHSLWSAALCRAGPYNLNIPPVNMLDNEKLGGHYIDVARKASTQQSGPPYAYTISQGGPPGMAGSGSTLNTGATGTMPTPNHTSGAGVSADAGTPITTGSGAASGNAMAAHAQYIQAMMQQNGFASFPFPIAPPGQAAQFFNNPFFPPHLMPPLPHLQPLPQQAGNVLPVQKQQQGLGSLAHSNSAQLVAPPLQQQQLQLQLAPQSPSQSQQQQHNHVGISAQQFGIHSDKESTAGSESLSTAESRLNAMQRSMSAQGSSNLPNLNISPSSLMLATNMPAMPSHDQEAPPLVTSGGKQTAKSQQQPFHGQSPVSLSSSLQPQQFNAGSGPGLQMKGLDPTLSQGYSAMANRGPVGPGPLGLVSVSSMVGTPGLGVLPGSTESTKGHAHQQQGYGGHTQQFQRPITKAPSGSEDSYAVKVRDYTDDKKMLMKPVGGPALLSRVDMEVSSPSLQGSPTSGSAPSSRISSSVGRNLNSVTPAAEARSSRPSSSAGSGQAPLLQNQPQKQAMGRAKNVSGSNMAATPAAQPVAAYTERGLPGNLGKFTGTVLPFSGQVTQTSQSSKPNHAGVKVGVQQRMSPGPAQQVPTSGMAKSQVQQARSNQQGVPSTPPRMLPSVSASMMSAGTIPMSVPKGAAVAVSKSPSNGKGSVSMPKAGPPAKKPPVSGPAISSVVSPGQNMSARAPAQQKSPASAAHVPQFSPQQSSMAAHQQRLATKSQVYPPQLQPQQGQYKQPYQPQSQYRPQLFLQPHQQQQYMQQQQQQQPPSQQQQAVTQHTQSPVSHHYQSNPQSLPAQHSQASQQLRSDSQLSHLQQQFQPVSSSQPSSGNNGLSLNSPNLTLGTAVSGNMSSSVSSDGADQFKGAGMRTNPPKTVYTSGNPLPSGGMPELITTAHPAVSGQGGSPHSGSSHYLQLAPVKSTEQKPLPDVTSREEMTMARHLASPSSSQAAVASNPSSS
eukprot:c23941_g1_i2 orf=758-5629(-)